MRTKITILISVLCMAFSMAMSAAYALDFNPSKTSLGINTTFPTEKASVASSTAASNVRHEVAGEDEIIYEAPEGERVELMTRVLGWVLDYNGNVYGTEFAGKPAHYILTEDDCIYLFNSTVIDPFGPKMMNTYIKGVKDGDEYLFTFPQAVYTSEDENGDTKVWYLNNLRIQEYDDGYNEYVVADDNSIRMRINEDGSLEAPSTLDEDKNHCVGVLVDGKFNGFGSVRMLYRAFNFEAAFPPSDAQLCDAELKYTYYGSTTSADLNYCIVDNDIWIQGLGLYLLPYDWAHGTIDGDNVLLDQYLGFTEDYNQYVFVRGYNDENLDLHDVEFSYNRDELTLTAKTQFCINPNNEFCYPFIRILDGVITLTPAGVEDVMLTNGESQIEWYDMLGRKVENPEKGIFIRVASDTKGNRTAKKVVK